MDSTKMHVEEFIDSFNKGIADNMVHTFEFPGKVLKDRFSVESSDPKKSVTTHPIYMDEVIHHELHELKTKELRKE